MDFRNCQLEHAVLHDVLFIPGAGGKGLSLKSTLSISSIEGRQAGLKITLLNDTLVFIETKVGSALVPIGNFKLLVPMKVKQAQTNTENDQNKA